MPVEVSVVVDAVKNSADDSPVDSLLSAVSTVDLVKLPNRCDKSSGTSQTGRVPGMFVTVREDVVVRKVVVGGLLVVETADIVFEISQKGRVEKRPTKTKAYGRKFWL